MGNYVIVDNKEIKPIPINLIYFEGSPIDNDNPITIKNSRSNLEGAGKVLVGTTAVEVEINASPTYTIIITADKDNDGVLYIGKSNVTNAGANAITFLERGDSVSLDYEDLTNALYVVSDTASQNFWAGATL